MSVTEATPPARPALIPAGICYVIFILSGCAGLIYEATWSRYLKSILGHEAYAQALVLAIFLGGLAVGAAWIGRYLATVRHPLIWYAVVEAVLALAAVFFHDIFVEVRGVLDGGLGATTWVRWVAATLLIVVESILLGMTFPLLASAVVRGRSEQAGRVVAWLYCCNSLGGVVGSLLVGLVLVEAVGLPGAMYAGALASAGAGFVAWIVHHRHEAPELPAAPAPLPTTVQGSVNDSSLRLLVAIAVGTGFASLVYEVVWIRMLVLITGSLSRSFELMLAAFIFGLALGGYYVRRWPDRSDRLQSLAKVQLLMGALAIAGIFYYEQLFRIYQLFRALVPRSEDGYQQMGGLEFLLALLLMFGPTFCAGMTLPLLTRAAMAKIGERALGSIYAWNTGGAILGIAVTTLLLLPLLGLKYALLVGAGVDLLLGVMLLSKAAPQHLPKGAMAAVSLIILAVVFPNFNQRVLMSGPYRTPTINHDLKVIFYQDGSTLSAAVLESDEYKALFSNGRSEGQITKEKANQNLGSDSFITNMLPALAMLYHPHARTAAVIGYGLGESTEILLDSPHLEQVTTLEIEQAIIDASTFLPERVRNRVFGDPRSQVEVIDAKTWLASQANEPLDILVSNPSHTWVSGIASLFTVEHFRAMHRALAADGVLVQWLHLYEMSPEGVATVLGAVGEVFDDYIIYTHGANLIIVTSPNSQRLAAITDDAFQLLPQLAKRLQNLSINGPVDMNVHFVGNRSSLEPYFNSYRMPPNSDYFPLLDSFAGRAQFLRTTFYFAETADKYPNDFISGTTGDYSYRKPFTPVSPTQLSPRQEALSFAVKLTDGAYPLIESVEQFFGTDPTARLIQQLLMEECTNASTEDDIELASGMMSLLSVVASRLQPEELKVVWQRLNEEVPCMARVRNSANTAELYQYAEALVAGDYAAQLALGLALLPQSLGTGRHRIAYRILVQSMTAAMQLGEYEAALEIGYRIPPVAPAEVKNIVRYLGAHALAALDKADGQSRN